MSTPKEMLRINEDLLYYVWSLKNFDLENLQTAQGQMLQIINGGMRNHDSGPDFLHAKIRIDDQIWVGHVEMHVNSSDWLRHNHQEDRAFQNVILHVVFNEDQKVCLPNGEELACLQLKDRIQTSLLNHYKQLMLAATWIPCERNVRPISAPALRAWYECILVERLAQKTQRLDQILKHTEYDWEEAFYRVLGRNFGFNVNADVFEALMLSLPRRILIKHKDKLKHIEALLFGQAGLLQDEFEDEYANDLKSEYQYLQQKYQLTPLSAHQWKFMRMRPANFPTIRIAQFAVLFYKTSHLFSKMLATESMKEITNMFDSDVSGYWKTHYTFDQLSDKKSKRLGKDSIRLIAINTVIPFLFHYGQIQKQETMQDKALRLLEEIGPESNQIVKKFKALNLEAATAFDSQALIQLKTQYCDYKRCLQCAIGNSILKP